MALAPFLAMLGIVVVTILGDWLLKTASLRPNWTGSSYLFAGMAMYMMSGLGFFFAMRHMSLASVGVWYALLTILFMTALGVFTFGETLTGREMLGIAFAILALICMTRFA